VSEKNLLDEPDRYPPAAYVGLLKEITVTAKRCGYAIGLHGSLSRDMDIIACPWVESAVEPSRLVKALAKAVGGKVGGASSDRPHGRKSWTIMLTAHAYIDVSVMPRGKV